ncbi:MAG: ADP-ribosyltransferase [Methanobacteriaceae archaeon]
MFVLIYIKSLTSNTNLYRGLKNIKINNFKLGEIIPEKAFMSSTFDKDIAKSYSKNGVILIINARKGDVGAYLRQSSQYLEHMEWLIHRKYKLVVYAINKLQKEVFCKIE